MKRFSVKSKWLQRLWEHIIEHILFNPNKKVIRQYSKPLLICDSVIHRFFS